MNTNVKSGELWLAMQLAVVQDQTNIRNCRYFSRLVSESCVTNAVVMNTQRTQIVGVYPFLPVC